MANVLQPTAVLPQFLAPKYINFQLKMVQEIRLKYYNKHCHVAMNDWKTVYYLGSPPIQLFPEVERGRLTYRAKGSVKCVSYAAIKKRLIKMNICIMEQVPDWLM
ncbi:MAG: hypothetical protein ABUT20_02425 [Bacteroidota bacterium]